MLVVGIRDRGGEVAGNPEAATCLTRTLGQCWRSPAPVTAATARARSRRNFHKAMKRRRADTHLPKMGRLDYRPVAIVF